MEDALLIKANYTLALDEESIVEIIKSSKSHKFEVRRAADAALAVSLFFTCGVVIDGGLDDYGGTGVVYWSVENQWSGALT